MFPAACRRCARFYPPTDLNQLVTDEAQRQKSESRRWPNCWAARSRTIWTKQELANPIRYVNRDSAPFFFLHGEQDDPSCLPEQSRLLYDAH